MRSLSPKQLLIFTAIGMVLFYIPLVVLDQKMKDAGGPSIVRFEFVGNEQQAAQMMAEWDEGGRDYARWSLWIDYGFLLGYGAFLALAAIATRDFARANGLRRLAAVGVVAALAAVAAAIFDAVEDAFLLLTLGGHGGSLAPPIATASAGLKFLFIAVAIGYVVWGLACRVLRQRRTPSPLRDP